MTGLIRTVCRTHSGTATEGTSSIGLPALEDDVRHEADEVGQEQQVGLVPGRDGAEMPEAVPQRRVERRHHERVLGCGAHPHRFAHHPVDVAVVGDVVGVAVVGAERDPVRAVLERERQERLEVACHRRLADEEPHPRPQPLASLLRGEALVVGADPGRGIRLQALAEQPGRVAVDVLGALERELAELRRKAGDDAGEVHHLREPEHPVPPHQRLEVARRERPARRLERRGGHARGRHEVDVELEVVAGVEQPVDAVGAEHVRDLVRVGDDRGRAEREDEALELVDEELHRLDVHVRVDEAGHDEAARRVDRPRCRRSRRPRR